MTRYILVEDIFDALFNASPTDFVYYSNIKNPFGTKIVKLFTCRLAPSPAGNQQSGTSFSAYAAALKGNNSEHNATGPILPSLHVPAYVAVSKGKNTGNN
jgi:hypothetical protein